MGGEIFKEGKDYSLPVIKPFTFDFKVGYVTPPITILPGSKIKDGDRLRVDCFYYKAMVKKNVIAVCMSEPEVYDIWRKQVALLEKYLSPKKYFLSMDEIRAGGACVACKSRKMSMAQILGDCIAKQEAIIRKANPQAGIFIWSDMLDPNHNAHDKYLLVDGDFTGSWNYIPKDLVIVCWSFAKRKESLKFFSSLGFKTLAGAYYDGDTLDNPRGWLEVLNKTKGAVGIMYTTWRNKYDLLAPFGDLVNAN